MHERNRHATVCRRTQDWRTKGTNILPESGTYVRTQQLGLSVYISWCFVLQYEDPKRELFPEVMNLKQMIANFTIGKEVSLLFHGAPSCRSERPVLK